MVFFNIVKGATTWDFDDKFKFKVLGSQRDVECDEWNAEYTLWRKQWLRRACASSGSPRRQLLPSKTNPSQSGSPRGLSCSDHCTGKSVVKLTPISKSRMRKNKRRNASECAV